MRFEDFHVDAFGALRDWKEEGLAQPGPLVILGENECGKSTLLNFLVSMLYGFHPASRDNPYAPWDGTTMSGRVGVVLDDGSRASVVRRLMSQVQGRLLTDGSEQDLANRPVPWVSAIGRQTYRSLFALDLDDIGDLDDAQWADVQERLLGGASFPFLRPVKDAVALLEDQASKFWRPDRRSRPRAREIVDEIRDLKRQANEAHDHDARLRAIQDEVAALEAQQGDAADRLLGIRTRLRQSSELLPVLHTVRHIAEKRSAADAILENDDFPIDPVDYLVQLAKAASDASVQFEELAAEIDDLSEKTKVPEAQQGLVAEEPRIHDLQNRAALYAQDAGSLGQMERALAKSRVRIEEAASRFMEGPATDDVLQAIEALRLVELRGRIDALGTASRAAEAAETAAAQHQRRTTEIQDEIDAAEGPGSEVALRERFAKLNELQKTQAGLLAVQTATRQPVVPRWAISLGIAVLALALLIVAGFTVSNGGPGLALGPLAILVGVVVFSLWLARRSRSAEGESGSPADGLDARAATLMGDLGLQTADDAATELLATSTALAEVARLPRLSERLQNAIRDSENAGTEALKARGEADGARTAILALLESIPIAPVRLETPTQDLYIELNELTAVIGEAGGIRERLGAARERMKLYGEDAKAVAQAIGVPLPSDLGLAAAEWLTDLNHAVAAVSDAKKSAEDLERAKGRLDAAKTDKAQSDHEYASFAAKLAAVDSEDNDPESGARLVARARELRAAADALEHHLQETTPDWRTRLDEAIQLEAEGVALALTQEEKVALEADEVGADERKAEATRGLERLKMQETQLSEEPGAAHFAGAILQLEEEREEVLRRRDRLATLGSLIRSAERRYREENQPDVLRDASAYMRSISGGRYERLLAEEGAADGQRVQVVAAGEDFPRPAATPTLSRGTREQVYFALRLALCDHVQGSERLPIILDEVVVNWDPTRTEQVAEILATVAKDRQVLVLTCHPEFSRRLVAKGARVLSPPD